MTLCRLWKLWCGFSAFLIRDCGFLALASVLLQEQVYYLAVFLWLILWNMEDAWGTRFSCGAAWCVNVVWDSFPLRAVWLIVFCELFGLLYFESCYCVL